jgi:hypothetical protein
MDSRQDQRPVRTGIRGRKRRIASIVRAAVSDGTHALLDGDGSLRIARRFREIVEAVTADQGGAELCSESRLQLIRRFSAACVLAEQLESRLASGEQIDVAEHALLCSTLTRLSSRIGIDRVPREVTPDPLDYAREYDSAEAAE